MPALGRATEPTSETLEQRVARLSISIGTQAASAQNAQDRQVILRTARDDVMEDLVSRGHPLHEAALIADDIIGGARRLASELIAHAYQPR
jgi:siderophore synthetase component